MARRAKTDFRVLTLVAPAMSRARMRSITRTGPTVVVGHHDTAPEYDSVVDEDRFGAR